MTCIDGYQMATPGPGGRGARHRPRSAPSSPGRSAIVGLTLMAPPAGRASR
ncbi:MAG: hypothetical protein MZU95_04745 [Desulfomicrobium escambiense]|nr:hypothetical protein [Desulfomicrobium escambiense]